jgi:hypothetical protein
MDTEYTESNLCRGAEFEALDSKQGRLEYGGTRSLRIRRPNCWRRLIDIARKRFGSGLAGLQQFRGSSHVDALL